MKKMSKEYLFSIGVGIACFIIGASQIYRGLELLDYLPIIVIGFTVIWAGYSAEMKEKVED